MARLTRTPLLPIFILSLAGSLLGANLQSMTAALNGVYLGRIVTLRSFHSGATLRYGQDGKFLRGGKAGPWTLDADVLIRAIRVTQQRLRIRGNRLFFLYDKSTQTLKAYRGPEVSIEIALDPQSVGLSGIQRAISSVFVTEKSSMADLAPAYWKPYLLHPGSLMNEATAFFGGNSGIKGMRKTGTGEPKARYSPDPAYTEEALIAGLQGRVDLGIDVAADGAIKRVVILHPLGLGLDDAAALEIQKWKFSPAILNGHPVEVRMFVQITFGLGSPQLDRTTLRPESDLTEYSAGMPHASTKTRGEKRRRP